MNNAVEWAHWNLGKGLPAARRMRIAMRMLRFMRNYGGAVALLAGLMLAPVAQACDVHIPFLGIIVPPSPVTPSRIPGTPLTEWFSGSETWMFWNCSGPHDGSHEGLVGGVGSYTEEGQTFTIYPTSAPGVGVVYRTRPNRATYTLESVQQGVTKTPWVNEPPNAGNFGWLGQARLIERTGIVPGVHPIAQQKGSRITATQISSGLKAFAELGLAATSVTVAAPPTCNMPASIPVDLGDHRAAAFNAVGTVSSWVDFNIPLRNCPSTYTSLNYRITPTYGIGPGPGHLLLEIRPGGATGVMIDLWDSHNGQAPPFGTQVLLGKVAPGTPNVDLGFRARIYQTERRTVPRSAMKASNR